MGKTTRDRMRNGIISGMTGAIVVARMIRKKEAAMRSEEGHLSERVRQIQVKGGEEEED